MRWDLVLGADTYTDYRTSTVDDIFPTFWDKDEGCAQRLDIDLDFLTTIQNEDKDERENERESEIESDNEMSDDNILM